jgi:phosphoglycerate dehydrogenase-like enzyme
VADCLRNRFFRNGAGCGGHSGLILSDDVFARLLTFPNVIITGHQAFFTREALLNIAGTTIDNIAKFENDQPLEKLAG